MIKLKHLLNEDVYGNKATVYHRTNAKDLFDLLFTSGYQVGSGNMYGSGIYTTYEPTDSTSDNAYNYGKVQVKFSVDLIDFFIFDWDQYEKHKDYKRKVEEFNKEESTKSNFIVMQLKYYKVPEDRINAIKANVDLNNFVDTYDHTSKLAMKLFTPNRKETHHVNGIIFTGGRDGKVLVCYNPELLVPLSSHDDRTGETFNLKNIDKTTFKEYFKKYIKSKNVLSSYSKSKLNAIAKKYKLKYDSDNDCYNSDTTVFLEDDMVANGKIIINFGTVGGDFNCSMTQITSLEGCPREIGGDFNAENCKKLITLKGAPKVVNGDFFVMGCDSLVSLEGSPDVVHGSFHCSESGIKSLQGATKEVGGGFYCSQTQITSLEGCPDHLMGTFDCSYCKNLTSLQYGPTWVGKNFWCEHSGIKSLKGAPEHVGESFNCYHTKIVSLKGGPRFVGEEYDCSGTGIRTLEGSPVNVNGNFMSYGCHELISLKGSPKLVGETFLIRDCSALESLEYAPKKVIGDFVCRRTNVKSLSPLLKIRILGDIHLSEDMKDIEIPDELRDKIEFY